MKYKQVEAIKGGWCDDIYPTTEKPYRMACCDCGLVHEMEFSVMEVTKKNKNGSFETKPAPARYRVAFRAKRNNRATAAMRRKGR